MSWQTPREAKFSLRGPFIATRPCDAGDLHIEHGQVVTQQQFHDAGVADRVIQRMYAAHWLNMAEEADSAPEAAPAAPEAPPVAQPTENEVETPGGPENGSEGDEAAAGEASDPAATEDGAAAQEGEATAPSDTTPVAYWTPGFGKYWLVNAAGEKIDPTAKPMSKVEAEGAAAQDGLPLTTTKPGAATE